MIRVFALTAMAELILSGCTTPSDHFCFYANGARLDDTIESAVRIGLRFHASRGSMSFGRSAGGLPPDSLVENEAAILRDPRRLIETYHDTSRFSMRCIVVAPCSPLSVSRDLMRESAVLARQHGVSLRAHLARERRRRRLLPREVQPHPRRISRGTRLPAFDLAAPGFAGALHDPVAALVFCTPARVSLSVIDGHIVARDGHLTDIDLPVIIEHHNRLAHELLTS